MTEGSAASTHAIAAAELPGPVRDAVGAFAERHGISGLAADATMVVRTVSPAVGRRRRARAPQAETYAMLSPRMLVVVTTSDGLAVTAWRLDGAEARRITQFIGRVVITGLQVTAFAPGGAERQAIFVALAGDNDGSDFEAAVLDTITSGEQ